MAMTVTTEASTVQSSTVTPGSSAPVVHQDNLAPSVTLSLDKKKPTDPAVTTTETPAAGTDAVTTDAPVVEGEPTTTESPAVEASEGELGDYNPADPAVVAKYDGALFKDGTLNIAKLQTEWDGNDKSATKDAGSLNEGTYKYLQDKLGLPKAVVDELAAGLVAKRQAAATTFLAPVGGTEGFQAMLDWGSKGGYTDAQKAALNAALAQGGQAAADQRDLLKARFEAGTKVAPAAPRGRPNSPAKSATDNTPAAPPTGPKGFDNHSAYREAFNAAAKLPQGAPRDEALALVRAKDRNSTYKR